MLIGNLFCCEGYPAGNEYSIPGLRGTWLAEARRHSHRRGWCHRTWNAIVKRFSNIFFWSDFGYFLLISLVAQKLNQFRVPVGSTVKLTFERKVPRTSLDPEGSEEDMKQEEKVSMD